MKFTCRFYLILKRSVSGKNEESTQTPRRGAPEARGPMQLHRLHRLKADPAHSSYFMCQCTEYKLPALQVRISEENKTQRYDTAVHNCKNIRLRVKTEEQNILIIASEQFTTAKSGSADVLSNTSSRA